MVKERAKVYLITGPEFCGKTVLAHRIIRAEIDDTEKGCVIDIGYKLCSELTTKEMKAAVADWDVVVFCSPDPAAETLLIRKRIPRDFVLHMERRSK